MKELWLRLLHYFGLGPRDWIVLVQIEFTSPSETVTTWQAYEAAPQRASTAAQAIVQFVHDRALSGSFVAVPADVWVERKGVYP